MVLDGGGPVGGVGVEGMEEGFLDSKKIEVSGLVSGWILPNMER